MQITKSPGPDEIKANIMMLSNVVNMNADVFNQRLKYLMEAMEEFTPGIIEVYTKKIFKRNVMACLLSNKQARDGTDTDVLQILKANNNVLDKLHEEAEKKGWLDVYKAAAREVAHLEEKVDAPPPGTIKEK